LRYDTDGVPTSALINQWSAMGLAEATKTGTVAAAIHAACYLSDCAIDAKLMDHKGALGDYGLVHALAHIAAGDTAPFRSLAEIAAHAEYLEAQLTEITARGKMNSCRVVFDDGFTMITSRNAIRRQK
jgi:hypothetical protein